MDEGLRELIHEFSEITGDYVSVDFDGVEGVLETTCFVLSFTINGPQFEIRNIETFGRTGLGRKLITAIHEYADEYDLAVIASNVLDTAIGFWAKMGYQEGCCKQEFFRAA